MPDRKAKQKLSDLRVHEISLVDDPANEEHFVLIKSLGQAVSEARRLLEQKGEVDMPDRNVVEELETKKAAGAATAVEPEGAEDAEATASEQTASDASKAESVEKSNDDSDLLTMIKALRDDLQKQKDQDAAASDETPEGVTRIEIDADGEVVIKGGKKFSRDRKRRMREIMSSMAKLMKEVDENMFKDLMGEVAAEPAGVAKSKDGHGADAAAALGEQINGALAKLAEDINGKFDEVSKRVANLEKSTAVSKGLAQDGNDKPQPSSKKSLWAGLL